ncbi:class I SAM-dependent methyltransferase [Bifidobacterium crudilactis]|jgi:SAM-dependent methyltransferase|uniref:class I SAM-dependent methyltransferase n=1 Tax=Bifidobacterium crudilactis TaxID=327277 RepID=UPI0023575B82|nr:class I SAM-dependent methyltransferase [Bifidobacterium crudilactis]MCI1868053.1 class I SAM-dependent methyltransferase [Bifidobacterium crudilactis]MDN5971532.1 class I SAM-dependent methyltransferase [Bifidobacterium crudilactis]MDN6000690.1 class I SAM-dependent methyltransferase [Bifidobacterium crudilactis]MDN6209214.1 class I SAM-dependent methyltransferase [Bifidobacterium crudilactis]MDN6234149.1 class I SAM-dependent methyltransferase [Bifidobacterium crudilactis]
MNTAIPSSVNYSRDIADNMDNWNDRATVHVEGVANATRPDGDTTPNGAYGDIQDFMKDPRAISSVVRRDLAVLSPHLTADGLEGSRLLHLQCHIGTDTLSWARLGASEVWGLDFSAKSLSYARDICARAGAGEGIHFVQSDARYASEAMPEMRGTFDVVVTSVGTITWLPDLRDWAQSIADLLTEGGVFMIRDTHPMLFALDNDGLTVVQDYFSGTETSYDSDSSYTAGSEGGIAHTRNHNWAHDFQEITSCLLAAGLSIEALGEHRDIDWKALPMLVHGPESEDSWRMPEDMPSVPLSFSVVARKR